MRALQAWAWASHSPRKLFGVGFHLYGPMAGAICWPCHTNGFSGGRDVGLYKIGPKPRIRCHARFRLQPAPIDDSDYGPFVVGGSSGFHHPWLDATDLVI